MEGQRETLALLLETLVVEGDPSLRDRLLLEAVMATGAADAVSLWRPAPGWRPVVARGLEHRLPPPREVEAILEGRMPPTLLTGHRVHSVGTGAARIGLVLGGFAGEESPGSDAIEALLLAFALVEAGSSDREPWTAPLPARSSAGRAQHDDVEAPESIRRLRHDLRNSLTSLGATRELLERFGSDLSAEESRRFVTVVDRECQRIGTLLGRAAGLDLQGVDRAAARGVEEALEAEAAALEACGIVATLHVDSEVEGRRVTLAGVDLGRVMQNLLVNAREAIADRTPGRVWVRVEASGTDRISIRVEDNGPGLPACEPRSLFDPGTSNRKGAGRGQGLAIVRDLVEAAGGSVRAWTRPQGGAAFELCLRARDEAT